METQPQEPQSDLVARLAIRELIDTYARCADRRLAEHQADLYTPEARTLIFTGDPTTSPPVRTLSTRAEHVEAFHAISRYTKTTHFIGQSMLSINGDNAAGETYCLAHHVLDGEDGPKLIVMAVRYQDTVTRARGAWLFSERRLIIDWTDTRPLAT